MGILGCRSCNKTGCPFRTEEGKRCFKKIVLVGNPNVGKSSLFNRMSNKYAEVSNYPGTTVSISRCETQFGELIDTPGIYSFHNCSDDEEITKKFLSEADIVINVINSVTIERDLLLTLQLTKMRLKMILVLNQADEAEKCGISIDSLKLGKVLSVRVIKTVAKKGVGIQKLKEAIKTEQAAFPLQIEPQKRSKEISEEVYDCLSSVTTQAYHAELNTIRYISSLIITQKDNKKHLNEVIGMALFNPLIGWPVAVLLLFLLFKLLGTFISGNVVDSAVSVFSSTYIPWIQHLIHNSTGNGFLYDTIVGEFGLLTMAPEIIFCILLPLITGYYIAMSILEDSGYLPRLAVLVDSFFSKIGLNGKAIIPILLGFGCGAMGTISTRILGTKKERTLVTALIGITIPCAAQQGIIMSLLAATNDHKIWIIYIATMLIVMGVAGKILNKFLPGTNSNLLIDIPPLRLPSITNCSKKTFSRVVSFIKESAPIFMLSSFFITVLYKIKFLNFLQEALTPIVVNVLNLPSEFSDVFVMGIIRRDLASVGVLNISRASSVGMNPRQILISCVVITLFVPCINALIVILKEHGVKEAISLWIGTLLISVAVGGIINQILRLFVI